MCKFTFKAPATETLHGTAYFHVVAKNEDEARAKLVEDASEFFFEFSEPDGHSFCFACDPADDWELI